MRLASSCLVAGALAAACISPAFASWPSDPSVNLAICSATGSQITPRLTSDHAGGFIAAWLDPRAGGTGDNDQVYVRRVDLAGTRLWSDDGIALCTVLSYKQFPTIVTDAAHGAIVGWADNRPGGNGVYARRVSANGTPLWASGGVALGVGPPGYQDNLTSLPDGEGGAWFLWRMWLIPPQRYQLFLQHVDAGGVTRWAPGGIAISPLLRSTLAPAIAPDDSGGVIASWSEGPSGSAPFQLLAQRLDASGQLRWGAAGVTLRDGAAAPPRPAMLAVPGGAVAVWAEGSQVVAQRVDGAGAGLWGATGTVVAAAPLASNEFPILAPSGADGAIVGWRQIKSGRYSLYAQRLDGGGQRLWLPGGVVVRDTANFISTPRVCVDNEGGAIFAWEDWREFHPPLSFYSDVAAARLTSSGSRVWPGGTALISNANLNQGELDLVGDGVGGALLAWADSRPAGATDIYSQNVRHDGTLGGSLVGVEDREVPHAGVSLGPGTPNPAGAAGASFTLTLPRAQRVSVRVVDATGRSLIQLAQGDFEAGSRRLAWNGRDREGRDAAPGLYWIVLEAEDGRAVRRLAIVR